MKRVQKGRKSPITFGNSHAPKMGAGGADLKATQKMFGVVKPKKKAKMIATERKRKQHVKYSKVPAQY